MGKAEDFFAARAQSAQADADAAFKKERAELYAQIDRELVGFAELAERARYSGAVAVQDYGGSTIFKDTNRVPRQVTYGWDLTSYDPDVSTRGCNSYITASTGDLYVDNWHYNDPAKKDMCVQRPEYLWGMYEVLCALQELRRKLEHDS